MSDCDEHAEKSWIAWLCEQPGHKWLCQVDASFIEDGFNLYGLSSQVEHYQESLSTILGPAPEGEQVLRQQQAHAQELYGLIHARFICTARGLEQMATKYESGVFGRCPRYLCEARRVLPIGLSLEPGEGRVKLYCPSCEDIYDPALAATTCPCVHHPSGEEEDAEPSQRMFGSACCIPTEWVRSRQEARKAAATAAAASKGYASLSQLAFQGALAQQVADGFTHNLVGSIPEGNSSSSSSGAASSSSAPPYVLPSVLLMPPFSIPSAQFLDGAFFGPTFPHLLLLTYSEYASVQRKSPLTYIPRIFGFRVASQRGRLPPSAGDSKGLYLTHGLAASAAKVALAAASAAGEAAGQVQPASKRRKRSVVTDTATSASSNTATSLRPEVAHSPLLLLTPDAGAAVPVYAAPFVPTAAALAAPRALPVEVLLPSAEHGNGSSGNGVASASTAAAAAPKGPENAFTAAADTVSTVVATAASAAGDLVAMAPPAAALLRWQSLHAEAAGQPSNPRASALHESVSETMEPYIVKVLEHGLVAPVALGTAPEVASRMLTQTADEIAAHSSSAATQAQPQQQGQQQGQRLGVVLSPAGGYLSNRCMQALLNTGPTNTASASTKNGTSSASGPEQHTPLLAHMLATAMPALVATFAGNGAASASGSIAATGSSTAGSTAYSAGVKAHTQGSSSAPAPAAAGSSALHSPLRLAAAASSGKRGRVPLTSPYPPGLSPAVCDDFLSDSDLEAHRAAMLAGAPDPFDAATAGFPSVDSRKSAKTQRSAQKGAKKTGAKSPAPPTPIAAAAAAQGRATPQAKNAGNTVTASAAKSSGKKRQRGD